MKDEKYVNPAALGALAKSDIDSFLVASTPGGIERQEAQGQKDFVNSTTLPKKCPKQELESLGFVFGDDVDDLFVSVEMPKGWKKEATDHSMWSYLLDNKGRKRGSIFYKAAFYDRSAHMDLERFISYGFNPLNGWDDKNYETNPWIGQVHGGDKVLFQLEEYVFENNQDQWKKQEEEVKKLRNWVIENYPDYDNPLAYWDQKTIKNPSNHE